MAWISICLCTIVKYWMCLFANMLQYIYIQLKVMICVVTCVCFCVFAIVFLNLSFYCMQTYICWSTPCLILTLQGKRRASGACGRWLVTTPSDCNSSRFKPHGSHVDPLPGFACEPGCKRCDLVFLPHSVVLWICADLHVPTCCFPES